MPKDKKPSTSKAAKPKSIAAKKPATKKTVKATKTPKPVEAEVEITESEESDALGFSLQDYMKSYWYIIVAFIVIIAIIGAFIVWKPFQATAPSNEQVATEEPEIESTTLPRLLDGIEVPRAEANQVPVCVMIENAAFGGVRPQSGLSEASVVYEVIVEGGITRFMAVFPTAGENITIGPVRSARDTYLEFASEIDCAYVHAGGSFSAMQAIPQFKLKDIDALREGKWFNRRADKVAPHDLFTDRDQLREAITVGHSWTEPATFESWKFVETPDGTPSENISIQIGGSYNAEYTYNATKGSYDRSNSGEALTDENTGDQISAQNVIVQRVPPGVLLAEKGRINFSVTGEGQVDIFRHGLHTTGTWKKADRLSRTKFYDENDQEIELVPGQTWVHIVPDGYTVDWTGVTQAANDAATDSASEIDETVVAD